MALKKHNEDQPEKSALHDSSFSTESNVKEAPRKEKTDNTDEQQPTSPESLQTEDDFIEKTLSEASPDIKELLLDPAILYRFKKALDKMIVGETKNKLLLFLIALTSHMDKVLGAVITGESSAGKSHLMNSVLKFFGNVEEYTRITEAAPDRMAQDFRGKILKVEELRGAEKAQASLRVWISEGELKLLTTTCTEDGKITTEEITTCGVPCFITTTTSIRPDRELMNRLFLISIDETETQTKKVLEFEAVEFTLPNFDKTLKPPQELVDAINTLALSPFDQVLIPFAPQLAREFPSENLKARRDFKKLLYIISAVAFLHQYQRPIAYTEKHIQYVVALPIDFDMAWLIAEQGMKETLMNVQKRSLRVLELFTDTSIALTSRRVAFETELSQNRAREILNGLVDSGYLVKDKSSKEHCFSRKKDAGVDATIGDFKASVALFDEKRLGEWLDECQLITRRRVWTPSYVNPLTGRLVELSYGRVLTEDETTSKPITAEEEKAEEPTKRAIVTSLDDLTSVYWGESEFDMHECGVCGYEKMTCWQGDTTRGETVWLCEGCVNEYKARRTKTR